MDINTSVENLNRSNRKKHYLSLYITYCNVLYIMKFDLHAKKKNYIFFLGRQSHVCGRGCEKHREQLLQGSELAVGHQEIFKSSQVITCQVCH